MHLFMIFLLCAVVYGIGRISEPDLRAVNFADKIEGQKLNGSLIREIEVDSESSCQLECVDEERCQSYNFGIIKDDSEKFKCQLSDSDRFAVISNLTEDNNFIYREIKESNWAEDPSGVIINTLDGFGNLKGEFWLGNHYLYRLTQSADITVRIDMEDYDSDRRFAEYTTFSVADEDDNYRVTIDGYRGDVGDSLVLHSKSIRNMSFTIREWDNDFAKDANCALRYKSGWWYSNCHAVNPNGLYQGGRQAQGITRKSFRGQSYSLKQIEIKLRPA
ncbi:Techylectin-5B [Stylophora pistillata]|uniref:Techylectin-5B n=1 Tax=Stylophora pistillata TaxID=50429 RepID=A0A2B4RAJ9_STYPI|nr:Techylectin-5B [Stylophora pistillata]